MDSLEQVRLTQTALVFNSRLPYSRFEAFVSAKGLTSNTWVSIQIASEVCGYHSLSSPASPYTIDLVEVTRLLSDQSSRTTSSTVSFRLLSHFKLSPAASIQCGISSFSLRAPLGSDYSIQNKIQTGLLKITDDKEWVEIGVKQEKVEFEVVATVDGVAQEIVMKVRYWPNEVDQNKPWARLVLEMRAGSEEQTPESHGGLQIQLPSATEPPEQPQTPILTSQLPPQVHPLLSFKIQNLLDQQSLNQSPQLEVVDYVDPTGLQQIRPQPSISKLYLTNTNTLSIEFDSVMTYPDSWHQAHRSLKEYLDGLRLAVMAYDGWKEEIVQRVLVPIQEYQLVEVRQKLVRIRISSGIEMGEGLIVEMDQQIQIRSQQGNRLVIDDGRFGVKKMSDGTVRMHVDVRSPMNEDTLIEKTAAYASFLLTASISLSICLHYLSGMGIMFLIYTFQALVWIAMLSLVDIQIPAEVTVVCRHLFRAATFQYGLFDELGPKWTAYQSQEVDLQPLGILDTSYLQYSGSILSGMVVLILLQIIIKMGMVVIPNSTTLSRQERRLAPFQATKAITFVLFQFWLLLSFPAVENLSLLSPISNLRHLPAPDIVNILMGLFPTLMALLLPALSLHSLFLQQTTHKMDAVAQRIFSNQNQIVMEAARWQGVWAYGDQVVMPVVLVLGLVNNQKVDSWVQVFGFMYLTMGKAACLILRKQKAHAWTYLAGYLAALGSLTFTCMRGLNSEFESIVSQVCGWTLIIGVLILQSAICLCYSIVHIFNLLSAVLLRPKQPQQQYLKPNRILPVQTNQTPIHFLQIHKLRKLAREQTQAELELKLKQKQPVLTTLEDHRLESQVTEDRELVVVRKVEKVVKDEGADEPDFEHYSIVRPNQIELEFSQSYEEQSGEEQEAVYENACQEAAYGDNVEDNLLEYDIEMFPRGTELSVNQVGIDLVSSYPSDDSISRTPSRLGEEYDEYIYSESQHTKQTPYGSAPSLRNIPSELRTESFARSSIKNSAVKTKSAVSKVLRAKGSKIVPIDEASCMNLPGFDCTLPDNAWKEAHEVMREFSLKLNQIDCDCTNPPASTRPAHLPPRASRQKKFRVYFPPHGPNIKNLSPTQ